MNTVALSSEQALQESNNGGTPADEAESELNPYPHQEGLSIREILEVIETANTVAICGHVNPDGDALGSALALKELLVALGKDVKVLLGQDSPAPELYEFLPGYDFVYASEYTEIPDLFIVVDASTAKRLGTAEELLKRAKKTMVIDHHKNYEGFADYYLGDVTAPAAASIIWRIIKESPVEPTLTMALYCYIGIMTDTGRFAYKNTNRSAFADVVEMIDLGINPAEISESVYDNKTVETMRLEALCISRAQFSCTGCVVYSYICQSDLAELGVDRNATEQLPAILRSIKGVEVAILFREEGDEGVRVNLRSRSNYDVGAFALSLGGGGHAGAAGLTLEMSLEEAIPFIADKMLSQLPSCNKVS